MAKRNQDSSGPDTLGIATLGGMVILLMIAFSNWRAIDSIESDLDRKLTSIENRIGQVANRPAAPGQPAAQQPPRRTGPDPDRVYQIKTAGAPVKGPANAPITIAEFSDFQ